jgi:4-hydroxythreonine-4-phosphate dehydrogenase
LKGKINLLVTAPIDKNNIQSGEFSFKGHTDYLKSRAGAGDALMFMVSESLKIGLVTDHVPLRLVPGLITKELLLARSG